MFNVFIIVDGHFFKVYHSCSHDPRIIDRKNTTFQYCITYTFCQDHLELLFSCIRGKNGCNNNPDVRCFKSVLKNILLRTSVVASRHGNCLGFENDYTNKSNIFTYITAERLLLCN